ncbi:dihydrolipoamide acetyltransferase family protein [Aneurinibacillus sp. Ricciae_BoGa-3]|uniref:dihydrolipoamide acetyltransferase family protein n=1 Tax=Aneurinibacillus sp. Ricciae_BoGa-3 TaxID=3022697 RepID=UPI002342295A|nr:dihydrolipoamide acetyltransferase family protein [Aneurinibacillus sp. Ricciae_BoGa-3]WCK54080.1 dihydrolipoamide acetyltransferase family protein [Aneurinibacillus sp. Ricciae_BoGa-3]
MYSFVMPKVAEDKAESLIVFWHKSEGDFVKEGEVLVEVQTEKAVSEIESPISGRLTRIEAKRGDVVAEGHLLAVIEAAAEHLESQKEIAASSAVLEKETKGGCQPVAAGSSSFVQASPFIRRLARELKVDLGAVQGSGPKGRITEQDVRAVAQNRQNPPAALETKPEVRNSTEATDRTQLAQATGERIKIEGTRRIIGQRMVHSASTAPHVTLVAEVDMGASMELRNRLLPVIEKKCGYRLSYTEIIIKAVSQALTLHPKVNASLDGDFIILHPEVNVGLAVAAPNGLVVPVVQHADKKGLAELTTECKNLTGLARENKLTPDHMSGGTFTISNLGMYAIDAFTPIINQPQSAILGVGRIHDKPVGVEGKIELRPMMTLSLSFDHRVIDGAPAAEFLQAVKDVLENPYQMIV